MHFMRSSANLPLKWLIIILFSNTLIPAFSDPRIEEAGLFCGTSKPPPNTTIVPTFVEEMEKISQLVSTNKWGLNIINHSAIPLFCLAQCFNDLSRTDCLSCYAASRTRLPRCLPALSGRLYLDGCFLRYDTYDFFDESVDPSHDRVNCSGGLRVEEGFRESAGVLIDKVSRLAILKGGFGVMEVEGVFGLAQCWRSLSKESCVECLEKAAKEVRGCLPSRQGRGLMAGCYFRYSDHKFYNQEGDAHRFTASGTSIGATAGIALSAAAFILLSVVAAYLIYLRLSRLKEEPISLSHLSSFNKPSVTYKYETLEKSTNYFSNSRKLGEGASGSVFKAKLPNGNIVAVKRLFFNTRQWVDEFFNEVNLISGIQHKNLVKLLGCSIEGPESLLVYEYVPNKNLDQFLFDKNMGQSLNWEQRFAVIVGTAEGLAYLHSGCEMRIIHRDIKSSNVLLDDDLTPKIADFGLARCFGTDKTHLSTGIAGTLGYMAPEYLIRGQLTEKADVYSFGVLVLEIVCGRKNITFTEDSGSLLQTIWRLYKNHKLVDVVDPRLQYDFPTKEVTNVVQIGLLCTQASAVLRPSMNKVVWMLNNQNCEVPMPKQPPFLSSKMEGSASSGQSTSLGSLISSALTKIDVSYTSTDSSCTRSSQR
ncbi:hypothetical protein ACET3Z_001059 [Daucus carota]